MKGLEIPACLKNVYKDLVSRQLHKLDKWGLPFHSKLGVWGINSGKKARQIELTNEVDASKLLPVSCCHYIVSLSVPKIRAAVERTPCNKIPVHVLKAFLFSVFLKQSR